MECTIQIVIIKTENFIKNENKIKGKYGIAKI